VIKVLIVDDSALVRKVLSDALSKAGGIDVVGTAIDPYVARDKVVRLNPDVVTLDIEMPRMDGLTFLRRLMKYHPVPVVVVSSFTQEGSDAAIQALELGAVDVVGKPSAADLKTISNVLVEKVRLAAAVRCTKRRSGSVAPGPHTVVGADLSGAGSEILAIGASTGGPEAIRHVLGGQPANGPGTLIVQHMPPYFTASFAKRLSDACPMEVREAEDGAEVSSGLALVAPGGKHLVLQQDRGQYRVQVKEGPPVHHQCPSVDVLFHSVARNAGHDAVGVLLTGMGADGARGLLAMKEAGAHTFAQDEDTCTVFGMPKEAIRMEAAHEILPVGDISARVLEIVERARRVGGSDL